MRLGKQGYKHDDRTLKMSAFMTPQLQIERPPVFDYDEEKAAFPIPMWGNNEWGDCVFAGQANGLLRLERAESHHTPRVKDEHVISVYKELTGAQEPGDELDQGFVVLDALNWWRKVGWKISRKTYTIAAYGWLDFRNPAVLRDAIYGLRGIYLGFNLPLTAARQTDQGYWDTASGPGSEPGTWGGHLVYAKRYDEDNIYVLTWGREIRVSNGFFVKYCDEAWAVVDALDTPSGRYLNVEEMESYLRSIGAHVL